MPHALWGLAYAGVDGEEKLMRGMGELGAVGRLHEVGRCRARSRPSSAV